MSSQNDASSEGTTTALNLEGLAPEIVSNVINQVDGTDTLKSLRLVSKSMDEHARRKMFEQINLNPGEDAIARWKAIADSESLSTLPRHAVIQTRENLDDPENKEDYEMDDFHDAIDLLSRFPRLNSVQVTFTADCHGVDDDVYREINECILHREEMLKWVFQAIKDRNAVQGASKIRSLTLRNLQNAPLEKFTDSELFLSVMQHLEELHIEMIQEYTEHGPDGDYERIELQTFPGHLVSKWLKPVAPNLKALSLYSEVENWGCFPGYFDPSGISFPKLETLSLGHYTLTYDDQLDWILTQCKSLTKLVMHNCMIASLISIDSDYKEQWKTSTRDWEPLGDGSINEEYRYRRTWSHFFDKIADGLPNLKEFCFDHVQVGSHWGDEDTPLYGVENRQVHTKAEVFSRRYVVFDDGTLPSRWLWACEDGRLEGSECFDNFEGEDYPNYHVEFLEKDKESLDRLLEKCRARREGEGV